MKLRLKNVLLVSITIAFGFVVLLGYFVPAVASLRVVLLRWAVMLTGVLLLVGVLNLARVHLHKIQTRQPGSFYSFVLLVSLIATFLLGFFGPTKGWARWIFDYVQIPVESSLMAILAVVLAYACARMLNRRLNFFTILFFATVVLVILGTISFPGIDLPFLRSIRDGITQVLAVGGARGILLGVGLGTIATGLRILIGSDRPYGG